MANNPRHGDEIIIEKPGTLGGKRLIASRQFQEFLDGLATIEIAIDNGLLDDIGQEIEVISSSLSRLMAIVNNNENDALGNLVDIDQQLEVLSSSISKIRAVVDNNSQFVSDLEQLIYVN